MHRLLESLLAQARRCNRGADDCRFNCRRCNRSRRAARDRKD